MPNEFVARNGIIAFNNSSITGSLGVSSGITGSLFGTASWATNAVTSSYILNAVSASFASTASFVNPLRQDVLVTGSIQITGSKSTFINIAPNDTVAEFVAGGSTNIRFSSATVGSSAAVLLVPQNGTLTGQNYSYFTITGASSKLKLSTDNSANPIEMQGGNVLLNTTTDAGFRLDVNGTSRFQNNMLVTGSVTATSATINGAVTLYSVQKNQADQSNPLQFYVAYNHINPRIEFWGGQGARLHYITNTRVLCPDTASGVDLGTSALNFGNVFSNTITVNTSSFFATVSGSVGIGKTTANSTLDVNGNTTITGSLNVTGSITTTGTITAQTLVVQTITSSVSFMTGSTRFGSLLANTHQFTGSVSMTGSLTATSNVLVTGSLLISTGSLSDFLRTSNAGVTNFRISSSGYPVWGVPGFDVISVPVATWTPIVSWDGTNIQWGDNRANRSIMTPGIGGGYVTVPNITFINATYTTQVNNLFGNSFIVNNNNVTSTLGTVNMVIQATGSQTGNMLQFKNGAGSVLSGVDASGSLFINKTTANARLDVNGPTIISGSLTVFTGSAVELQVTNTGVRIGNVITDAHTVTGSLNISGSVTATNFTGSLFGTSSWAINALTSSLTTRVTGGTKDYVAVWDTGGVLTTGSIFNPSATGNVGINNLSPDYKVHISGSTAIYGGGLIVSGTLATSGSTSQGLIAPLKFTTATANTNYTLVRTDEGKMVEMNYNVDAPLTVTIPLNSSVSFPIGTEISIIQIGAGTTVITGSSGVTVNSYLGFKTIDAQYGVASVVKRGTDSWYLFGNLS